MTNSWKSIGRIGHPHGLKGDFLISGRRSLLPEHIKDVRVGETAEAGFDSKIIKNDIYKERNLLHLQKVNTRNALEALQGQTLWIPEGVFENPMDALLGKQVFDSQGVLLGHIVEVNCFGASDILEIVAPDKRHVGIPFIADYCDLETAYSAQNLTLLVTLDTFDGCWY